jgi:hypothetical protein
VTTPRASTARFLIRASAVVLMAIGVPWALALLVFGGGDLKIFRWTITSHEPLRPMAVAAVGLVIHVWIDGALRWAARWDALAARVDGRLVAGVLAALVFSIGVVYGSTAGSGSDSYGYVSQADLWIEGRLKIDQPWAAEVPWPNANWTFSPLGYRPIEQAGVWTIVPTYSAGLPLMMAAAKRIGGQEAMFWVVPLFGGALVLATYGIGRRLGSERAGLAGAWLLAMSPAMLWVLVLPMSDVPVAAAWAVAFYFLLGPGILNASAAGLAVGLSILIRPNLALQAVILALWYVVRIPRDGIGVASSGLAFVACMAPGVVAVALINDYLYGSPFSSGYGNLGDLFSSSYIWPNLRSYAAWTVEMHTPFILAGVVAIFVPLRRLWPSVPDRRALAIIALFVAALWVFYFAYLPFDAWWFLRFLLPSWPFIMIGTGAVAVAVYRTRRPALMVASAGLMLAIGVIEFRKSANGLVFEMWRDRRFASVALEVREVIPESSVVFTKLHSGTVRYYGGRMTMRYDYLEPEWLDRSVVWMAERGVVSFALLEEWEVEEFRQRFAGQKTLQALAVPRLIYQGGATPLQLFRLTESRESTIERRLVIERFARTLRSVEPEQPPRLVFSKPR